MKAFVLIIGFIVILYSRVFAQEVVYDPQHFLSVTSNGAVRSTAEGTHNEYLGKINNNLTTINTNAGSVVLAQTMIYNGLANVNSALKHGLAVKNMVVIVKDITEYLNQCAELAKSEPYLLLFASNFETAIQTRSIALVNDVSGYVLKQGDNVLADYNSRDQLLRKVVQQLQIIDGLAYGAWRAMFWAKQRGLIASANPFAAYISKDKSYVTQIIANAKYLQQ